MVKKILLQIVINLSINECKKCWLNYSYKAYVLKFDYEYGG